MKTCTEILCFKKTYLQIAGIHVRNIWNTSLFLLDAQKSQIMKGRLQKDNFVLIIEKKCPNFKTLFTELGFQSQIMKYKKLMSCNKYIV